MEESLKLTLEKHSNILLKKCKKKLYQHTNKEIGFIDRSKITIFWDCPFIFFLNLSYVVPVNNCGSPATGGSNSI